MCVAWHDNTPLDTLIALAADPDNTVRAEIARYADLPVETATALAEDPDPAVRAEIARYADLPVETMTALAEDPDPAVRRSVVRGRSPLIPCLGVPRRRTRPGRTTMGRPEQEHP